MPRPGEELASLDFESMIGGPLIAVINAQAQAALTTVNFIKSVGFKPPNQDEMDFETQETNDPIYVKFRYPREITPYQPTAGDPAHPGGLPPYDNSDPANIIGDPAYPNGLPPHTPEVAAQWETHILEVPILTILPIPFIRVELATIDFNAKIIAMEYRKTDARFKLDTALTAGSGPLTSLVGSVKMKAKTSFQRNTQQGVNVKRTYSMAVHVRAVQDEIPAGMENILGILEESISGRPENQPNPVIR